MTSRIDLNADLGEGGADDAALMDLVTSTSIACGFHAGDPTVMVRTARLAATRSVAIGAHPSYLDRDHFGRAEMDPAREDLVAWIVCQVGALAGAAAAAGSGISYVKLHGALYNRAAVDPARADVVVQAVLAAGPVVTRAALLCPGGSELARRAAAAGLPVYAEVFADRAYASDGTLVPRGERGAVHQTVEQVTAQALDLALRGGVMAVDGTALELAADSICLHGDTPGAVEMAAAVRRALSDAGVTIAPF